MRRTATILAMTLGLALLLELALRLVSLATGEPGAEGHLAPLGCAAWLRVAVIGESSAAGFGSPLSFADVVGAGLRQAFPERCVAVRNLAEEGARFHADQARLARAILGSFDVLLIYAGNNEVLNGIFARGGAHGLDLGPVRDQRADVAAKLARAREQVAGRESFPAWLERRSRLLALARSTLGGALDRLAAALAVPRDRSELRPRSTSSLPRSAVRKVVPQHVIDRLDERYARDLRRLASRARRGGKLVVASTVVTFDVWPPAFSRRAPGLTDGEAAAIDLAVERAGVERLAGRPGAARVALERALALDPRHAGANHLRGLVALEAGDFAAAWRFLERARDEDGFPIRTLSTINTQTRALGAAGEVVVVDAERAIRDRIERGASFEDFLIDPQHPGPVGHLLIGRAFLCALHGAPGFARDALREACAPLDDASLVSWRTRVAGWRDLPPAAAFTLVRTRIAWLTRMRRLSAHPRPFFAAAARAWREHRAAGGATGDDVAAAVLAALGQESRHDRLVALDALAVARPVEVARMLRDGLTIDDAAAGVQATVLTTQDLADLVGGDGARLVPGPPRDSRASASVVVEVQ